MPADKFDALDSPQLLIDLDVVDANLERMLGSPHMYVIPCFGEPLRQEIRVVANPARLEWILPGDNVPLHGDHPISCEWRCNRRLRRFSPDRNKPGLFILETLCLIRPGGTSKIFRFLEERLSHVRAFSKASASRNIFVSLK